MMKMAPIVRLPAKEVSGASRKNSTTFWTTPSTSSVEGRGEIGSTTSRENLLVVPLAFSDQQQQSQAQGTKFIYQLHWYINLCENILNYSGEQILMTALMIEIGCLFVVRLNWWFLLGVLVKLAQLSSSHRKYITGVKILRFLPVFDYSNKDRIMSYYLRNIFLIYLNLIDNVLFTS